MTTLRLATFLAIAACSAETTSFRTTERTDADDRPGPAPAVYDVHIGRATAIVHVWSNGGYVGSSDDSMTHVGFEIRNTGTQPIVFDSDALELSIFDGNGARLPRTRFTAVTPLGPALVPIANGATVKLDAYFRIPVRPRAVGEMHVRWGLISGDRRYLDETRFVRDDDFPAVDPQQAPPPPLLL